MSAAPDVGSDTFDSFWSRNSPCRPRSRHRTRRWATRSRSTIRRGCSVASPRHRMWTSTRRASQIGPAAGPDGMSDTRYHRRPWPGRLCTGFRDESQLFIGGKWVDASGGTYDVVNPATEEVVGKAPNATVADAEAAAAAARDALPGWSATPPGERAALMARAAQAISARAEELLPLVIAETGATAAVGSSLQVPDRRQPLRAVLARSPPGGAARPPSAGRGGHAARARWAHQCVGVAPARGRRRLHHVVQLPARQHGGQGGPRARHGKHRRREARRPGSADGGRVGADPRRGGVPARRHQPRELRRRRARRRHWSIRPTWT